MIEVANISKNEMLATSIMGFFINLP